MLDLQIRWLIRRDLVSVLDIETRSYRNPWSEEDFLTTLRAKNCIGMVIEKDKKIVGSMIYELYKSRLEIMNFTVDPEVRRRGVGRAMVQRLVDKLHQQRRKCIGLYLRETNLDAQHFFKAVGFRALSVVRGYYSDTGEDGYRMVRPLLRVPEIEPELEQVMNW